MDVTVLAFARVREIIGSGERRLTLPPGATVADVLQMLVASAPALTALVPSTRIACNGEIVDAAHGVEGGDVLALLPPVGGG